MEWNRSEVAYPVHGLWRCFYCEEGLVTALPSRCSACGFQVEKPTDELTPEEHAMALFKKVAKFDGPLEPGPPQMLLAT